MSCTLNITLSEYAIYSLILIFQCVKLRRPKAEGAGSLPKNMKGVAQYVKHQSHSINELGEFNKQ